MKNSRMRWLAASIMILTLSGIFIAPHRAESTVGPAPAREFAVHAKRFEYTPNILHVKKGDHVTVHLVSEDVHHGMYIDGYELQTSAVPGRSGIIQFVADKSGRFSFRCSVTCGPFHPYMIGHLQVGPNTRFWGGSAIVLIIGAGLGLALIRNRKKEGQP